MSDDAKLLADLKAQLAALEEEQLYEHRQNGYQLNQEDIASLDELIQRALHVGSPDGLAQFMSIRVTHKIHGKITYEQLKYLKEVTDVFNQYRL